MRTNAILFIFQSNDPITESMLADIGQRMARHLDISGDIDTKVFNSEEIANTLVNSKQGSKISFEENKLNPAENAVVLIGTMMKEDLINFSGKASFKHAVMEKIKDLSFADATTYNNFLKAMR